MLNPSTKRHVDETINGVKSEWRYVNTLWLSHLNNSLCRARGPEGGLLRWLNALAHGYPHVYDKVALPKKSAQPLIEWLNAYHPELRDQVTCRVNWRDMNDMNGLDLLEPDQFEEEFKFCDPVFQVPGGPLSEIEDIPPGATCEVFYPFLEALTVDEIRRHRGKLTRDLLTKSMGFDEVDDMTVLTWMPALEQAQKLLHIFGPLESVGSYTKPESASCAWPPGYRRQIRQEFGPIITSAGSYTKPESQSPHPEQS